MPENTSKPAPSSQPASGAVYLVGAGPGDPGLLTLAGRDALARADAVVFDALANPRLMELAPDHAERIDVGKRAKHHKLTQDETNALLVELAQQGKTVVRLKGGDPYLYGRGAEEAAYCASHGVACEVIPGVTAGIAAPAYAGIPVTHRKVASTLTFVTGHEDPTKPDTSVDYASLAGLIKVGGTACFYMGVGRLPLISQELIQHGLSADTAVAVVQWGTLASQRSVRGTLTTIVDEVEREGIGAPAIIVVGQVAAIDEPGLDFFTARPLFGQRVVVTRTRQQSSDLRAGLEALGAEVLECPTIELVPPPSWDEVDAALRGLSDYDWVVLTSANAVDTLAERLEVIGADSRALAGVRLVVVGEATGRRLAEQLNLRPDLMPERAVGEAVARAIIETQSDPCRCLLLRADIARPDLPAMLREAGYKVDEVVAYETRLVASLPDEVRAALLTSNVDWVTFTSSSTARNLVELIGDDAGVLQAVSIASIGPITTRTLTELGLPPTVEASVSDVAHLVEAVAGAVNQA